MPNYDFICNSCSSAWDDSMPIADRDKPVEEPCPFCGAPKAVERLVGAPAIGDPVRLGIKKPPKAFQARLRDIAKKFNGGKINGRHGGNITET